MVGQGRVPTTAYPGTERSSETTKRLSHRTQSNKMRFVPGLKREEAAPALRAAICLTASIVSKEIPLS